MSLATVEGRRQWLNTLLEAALSGEVFLSEATSLIHHVKSLPASQNPFARCDLLASLELLIEANFIKAMTLPAASRDFFALLRSEYNKALARVDQEKDKLPTFDWLPILSICIYSWLTEASETPESDPSLAQDVTPISPREEREMLLIILSISALNAFAQVNYTGIPLTRLPEEEDTLASTTLYSFLANNNVDNTSSLAVERNLQLSALRLNGEDVYTCMHFPFLLLLARSILAAGYLSPTSPLSPNDVIKGVYSRTALGPIDTTDARAVAFGIPSTTSSLFSLPSVSMWALRALSAHQDTLLDNTAAVRAELMLLMNRLGVQYGVRVMLNKSDADHSLAVDTTAETTTITLSKHATSGDDKMAKVGLLDDITTGADTPVTIGASPFDRHNLSISNHTTVLETPFAHTVFVAGKGAVRVHMQDDGADATTGAAAEWTHFSRSVRACVCLETARLCRTYWQSQRAQYLLMTASLLARFHTLLTGVMGKRTRYQIKSHSQLMMIGITHKSMLHDDAVDQRAGATDSSAVCVPLAPLDTALYDCVTAAPEHPVPGIVSLSTPAAAVNLQQLDSVPDIPLDTMDDVYLHTPALDVDPADTLANEDADMRVHHLSWLGQLAALSHAAHIRTNVPNGDLATSEELAYVNACLLQQHRLLHGDGVKVKVADTAKEESKHVISHFDTVNDLLLTITPWGAHTLALHLRSRLELGDHRRQVRSLTQLETIGNVFRNDQLRALQPYHSDCGLHRVKASADTVRAATEEEADAVMAELLRFDEISTALPLSARRTRLVRWRMSALFTSGCPSWWHHKRAYAEIAVAAKLRQTALDAFVEIGLWEEVIDSLVELGRKAQAEKLVRSRLPNQGWLASVDGERVDWRAEAQKIREEDPSDEEPDASGPEGTLMGSAAAAENAVQARFSTAGVFGGRSAQRRGLDIPEYKLWSLLGDLRQQPAYWEKSWTISHGTFPRAQRALGRHWFVLKDYARAYEHLQLALTVNAANPDLWFTCGVCALELWRLSDAIECFSRAVAAMPDHAEAWNNLAACHLHCNNHKAAFGALEHAAHLRRDSWKVWENYLNCALTLKEYQKAASALMRLCDLRGTTDAGTLLPVQYSGTQAQLHMYAANVLTEAAVEDAMRAFRKNVKAKREQEIERAKQIELARQTCEASPNPLAMPGQALSESNIPQNLAVIEQSFLSFQVLSVLEKMEGAAASMVAQENNLGGRRRGGGVEAGMANSISAEMDLRERVKKDKERKAQEMEQAKEARRLRHAKRLAAKQARESGEVEEEEEDAMFIDDEEEEEDWDPEEAEDAVGELGMPVREAKKRAYETRMVAANKDTVYSLAQRYQVFLADCAARVNAGVQQYVTAAQCRERQAMLMMKDSTADWARDEEVVAEIEDVTRECVRLYVLAATVSKALQGDTEVKNAHGTDEMDARGCYTAARFATLRVSGALRVANRVVGSKVVDECVVRLDELMKDMESKERKEGGEIEAEAEADIPAEKDEYAAYADSYDSYW